ncbi:hypothetical protein GCM10007989_26800 [Devosia pacifica]|uniref:Uncharacterized protein n=1 Tax=Devosia pacifica TaxID=1335967 RepID=A0A918SAP8_9HYPH|nr:hypothetical protein GCM10007989_26800 [Devosia pacifica]
MLSEPDQTVSTSCCRTQILGICVNQHEEDAVKKLIMIVLLSLGVAGTLAACDEAPEMDEVEEVDD